MSKDKVLEYLHELRMTKVADNILSNNVGPVTIR
jgi:hypothetical protein